MFSRFDESLVSLLILLGSAGMLAGALFFQLVMGLHPCVLCVYQRIPYLIVIVLASIAYILFAKDLNKIGLFLLTLCALALFADAGIAGFHVGVENKWWEGTTECGQNLPQNATLEELRRAIMEAPIVRCTDIAWQMFGISMAGFNMMIAFAMGVFTSMSVVHFIKK